MFMGSMQAVSVQPRTIFANNLSKYSETDTFICLHVDMRVLYIVDAWAILGEP